MSTNPPTMTASTRLSASLGILEQARPDHMFAANAAKPLLLCLSHLRWDFVFQRPQHLLTRAAQAYRVIFFEEPIFHDLPHVRLDVSKREGGITIAVPHLPHGYTPTEIMRLQRILLDELLASEGTPTVMWYYSPMALSFSAHIDAPVCLYDCMDELSAFRGAAPDLTLWERRLFAKADFVLAGGRSLHEAKKTQHRHVTLLPSSIDTAHFASARADIADPEDQRHIAGPRFGFFGVIDERFDIELLEAAARRRPDWSFIMIGPVVKIDSDTLPRLPNIHWLGQKSYADLPSYLGNWDVGIMPFALNESTRFISPTKTPEFLAAALPVVSTAIADVVVPYGEAGLVEIAADVDDFISKAERVLNADRAAWLKQVDQQLAKNSWAKSWLTVQNTIRSALAETQLPGGDRDDGSVALTIAQHPSSAATRGKMAAGAPAMTSVSQHRNAMPLAQSVSAPSKE